MKLRVILLVAVVAMFGLGGPSDAVADIGIALEAELANTIMEPMVIAVPADADAEGGPAPLEPSNGEFVWAPGPPLTGGATDHKGYVEFVVNIPEAATYAVWGSVVAWDGNSDSFWVTWQPADPDEDAQVTQNTEFRWNVQTGNNWHWDRINQWLNAGTFDREWELDEGESILRIGTREAAAMLDAIFITDNDATDPASADVRLPTDEDRQLQISGLSQSVGSEGKISVTWARLKQH